MSGQEPPDLEHGGRISSVQTPYPKADELRLNSHATILDTSKIENYLDFSTDLLGDSRAPMVFRAPESR